MNLRMYDRHFFVPYGAVKTAGGSLELAKGEIGLFSVEDPAINGLTAYADLAGVAKTKKFVLKAGSGSEDKSRTGNNKDFSTMPFAIADVLELKASAPTKTEPSVDSVILGYNGIDPTTTISVVKGNNIPIYLKLTGKVLAYYGYKYNSVIVSDYINVPACKPADPSDCVPCNPCDAVSCKEPVAEAIERLLNKRLLGQHKLGDIVDITPVSDCAPAATTTNINTYAIEVCDTGDDAALALLKVQYPSISIVRVDRKGSVSKYQTVGTALPAAYQQKIASILKGCDNCPASWTAVAGGHVYTVTIEDEGADVSSTIEGLTGAVAGTGAKANGQFGGLGFYTVVTTAKLTKANIATFVAANPTATVNYLNKVNDICTNSTVTTTNWALIGTCEVSTKDFTMDVPDDECGNDRLAEIQAYYPSLTIALEGTTGGCAHRYKTTVATNVVCDECDPIFKSEFKADAPVAFGDYKWVPSPVAAAPTNCLCGIRFTAKSIVVDPGEVFTDSVEYLEDSVRIEVSAGYADMLPVENFPVFDEPIAVTQLSRWAPRTHVAGNMRVYEDMARVYFTGEAKHHKALSRAILNEESLLPEGSDQIVDYELTVRPHRYTAKSDWTHETVSYHIITYFGYHEAVETLLNNIAAAAGVEPVRVNG